MNVRVVVVSALLSLPLPVLAQEREMPPVVVDGLELLVSSGPDAAMDLWLGSWTSEQEQLQRAQLESGFRNIWDTVGPASSYEIVATCWLGSTVAHVYAVVSHQGQPLFVVVGVYHAPAGWKVMAVNAHTSVGEVIPETLLNGASQC